MSDQGELINSVLDDFTPLGDDHPVAQETLESVRAALEERANGLTTEVTELAEVELTAGWDIGVIRPGDTVLFSTTDALTGDQAAALKAQIAKELPGVKPIILSKLTVAAVYREEEGGE